MTRSKSGSKRIVKMLKELGYSHYSESAPSCRLIQGKFSPNPGVARCNPHCQVDRPSLLIEHHSVPGLELWHCPGCYKKLVIKVQRPHYRVVEEFESPHCQGCGGSFHVGDTILVMPTGPLKEKEYHIECGANIF